MDDRLVIGWGPLSRQVINRGTGPVTVVVSPNDRGEIPTKGGVHSIYADPTDPTVFANLDRSIRSVFVGGTDPEANIESALAARSAFGTVPVLAYTGEGLDRNQQSRLDQHNIQQLCSEPFVDTLLDLTASQGANRSLNLRETLQSFEGTLAVLTHDNPDPDAIASAIGLAAIGEHYGINVTPGYFGAISHQQNRAMINLLDISLRNFTSPDEINEFDHIALVDHTLPGVNDQLSQDTTIDIVIDHHQASRPPEGQFIHHRDQVGATSTLITQHLDRLSVPYDNQIATALYLGISVDTDAFTRQTAPVDYEAATVLIEDVDFGLLGQIESPTLSHDTFDDIGMAIRNRRQHGAIVVSYLGAISDRDTLAQAADWLLHLQDIETVLVYGIDDQTIHCSGRHRGKLSLDEVFRSAFDDIGSAGGHEDMAGAQIPIGYLYGDQEDKSRDTVIQETIEQLFLDAVDWAESATDPISFDAERPSFQSTGAEFEQLDHDQDR